MTGVSEGLLGASLGGRYRLERWLGGDDTAAFFLTSFSDRRAVLKLIPEDRSTAEQQLALWRRTAALSHPHLLPLLDFGRGDAAKRHFLYAVFEFPDDSLSSALRQGPLSETEAREAWNAVVEALRYIHSHGLVHGSLDPDHIVAVGDSIKLASDTLRDPSPSHSAADDFRALGSAGLLAAPPPAPPERPGARRLRFPKWTYAVLPVFLAAAVFMLRRSSHPSSQPAPPPVRPASTTRAAAPSIAPPETARVEPRGRIFWRVIAYTYATRRGAETKAERLNRKSPAFHAEVFTPKGKGRPPFMVALGGRMTRAEAVRVQKEARAKGLPRDTFVRNYAE